MNTPAHCWRAALALLFLFAGSPLLGQQSLESRGLQVQGWLQFDSSHAFSGGLPHALGYDGQYLLDLSVTVDTNKLLGWPGGTLLIDGQSHGGPSILNRQMAAIQDPDNMDAETEASLDRAWFQQNLWHKKLQVQAGLMYVDDQFLTVPFGQNFVSLNFSSDASISTFVLPTFPKGSFGADTFWYPTQSLYASFGVFNDHSTELPYDPGGRLYISEEGWQNSWDRLPYKLQVGFWRDTGRFQRYRGGLVDHASGAYLIASQKLWHPAASTTRGLGAFLQLGSAPKAVAPIARHVGAGVVWTGPWAARPHDEMGVAFSYGVVSSQNPGFTQHFENEIETYYQIGLGSNLTIQPDLEFWQHPSGTNEPSTLLGLVRMTLNF